MIHPLLELGRLVEVDTGAEELEHHLAAVLHPLGVGLDDHALLGGAGARRHERTLTLDLDDTHPADIDRGEVLRPAQGGRVDAGRLAGLVDRGALRNLDGLPVDRQRHGHNRSRIVGHRHDGTPGTRPSLMAELMALVAVWPKPQIEASTITWAMSSTS